MSLLRQVDRRFAAALAARLSGTYGWLPSVLRRPARFLRTRAAGAPLRRAARVLSSLPDDAAIHLGCGKARLDGWVNLDANSLTRPDIVHDLRLGLPVRPGTVRLIYSEHLFEHLLLDDARRLLSDCCRALRPGGVMRVAMPDLASLVQCYQADWRDQDWIRDPAYGHIDSAAHMLNHGLRAWGHLYVYDAPELALRLAQAGFVDVEEQPWGDSPIPELRGLETRPDSKLIMEGVAPGGAGA